MLIFNTSYFRENSKSRTFPYVLGERYDPNSKSLCFSANFHSSILRMDVKPNVISTFLRNVVAPRWNSAVNLIKRLYWTRKFNTLTGRRELKCHFHNNSSPTRYSDIETLQVHQLLELCYSPMRKKNLFSFHVFFHKWIILPIFRHCRWWLLLLESAIIPNRQQILSPIAMEPMIQRIFHLNWTI